MLYILNVYIPYQTSNNKRQKKILATIKQARHGGRQRGTAEGRSEPTATATDNSYIQLLNSRAQEPSASQVVIKDRQPSPPCPAACLHRFFKNSRTRARHDKTRNTYSVGGLENMESK